MIAHIAGILDNINKNKIVIDVNGVGYEILVTENVLSTLPSEGSFIKVFVYQQVREDDLTLFGFKNTEEKEIFQTLISVSGVGAKIALSILSSIDKDKLVNAIVTKDMFVLTHLPGIGKKTAERLVVELKDKLADNTSTAIKTQSKSKDTTDAIQALQQLGYNFKEISGVIAKIEANNNNLKTEEIIKMALANLGR